MDAFNELATELITVDTVLMPSLPFTFIRPAATVVDIVLKPPKTDSELRPGPTNEERDERPIETDCVENKDTLVDIELIPAGLYKVE
jgi:hypothetical protein